jgi:hypothetical protein
MESFIAQMRELTLTPKAEHNWWQWELRWLLFIHEGSKSITISYKKWQSYRFIHWANERDNIGANLSSIIDHNENWDHAFLSIKKMTITFSFKKWW